MHVLHEEEWRMFRATQFIYARQKPGFILLSKSINLKENKADPYGNITSFDTIANNHSTKAQICIYI